MACGRRSAGGAPPTVSVGRSRVLLLPAAVAGVLGERRAHWDARGVGSARVALVTRVLLLVYEGSHRGRSICGVGDGVRLRLLLLPPATRCLGEAGSHPPASGARAPSPQLWQQPSKCGQGRLRWGVGRRAQNWIHRHQHGAAGEAGPAPACGQGARCRKPPEGAPRAQAASETAHRATVHQFGTAAASFDERGAPRGARGRARPSIRAPSAAARLGPECGWCGQGLKFGGWLRAGRRGLRETKQLELDAAGGPRTGRCRAARRTKLCR